MTTFFEIAQVSKVNETDQDKVDSIKSAIIDGTFEGPALLVWNDMNQAVTGSHRIEAIRQLLSADEDRWENEEMELRVAAALAAWAAAAWAEAEMDDDVWGRFIDWATEELEK